jgi:hypothetical protein
LLIHIKSYNENVSETRRAAKCLKQHQRALNQHRQRFVPNETDGSKWRSSAIICQIANNDANFKSKQSPFSKSKVSKSDKNSVLISS